MTKTLIQKYEIVRSLKLVDSLILLRSIYIIIKICLNLEAPNIPWFKICTIGLSAYEYSFVFCFKLFETGTIEIWYSICHYISCCISGQELSVKISPTFWHRKENSLNYSGTICKFSCSCYGVECWITLILTNFTFFHHTYYKKYVCFT